MNHHTSIPLIQVLSSQVLSPWFPRGSPGRPDPLAPSPVPSVGRPDDDRHDRRPRGRRVAARAQRSHRGGVQGDLLGPSEQRGWVDGGMDGWGWVDGGLVGWLVGWCLELGEVGGIFWRLEA